MAMRRRDETAAIHDAAEDAAYDNTPASAQECQDEVTKGQSYINDCAMRKENEKLKAQEAARAAFEAHHSNDAASGNDSKSIENKPVEDSSELKEATIETKPAGDSSELKEATIDEATPAGDSSKLKEATIDETTAAKESSELKEANIETKPAGDSSELKEATIDETKPAEESSELKEATIDETKPAEEVKKNDMTEPTIETFAAEPVGKGELEKDKTGDTLRKDEVTEPNEIETADWETTMEATKNEDEENIDFDIGFLSSNSTVSQVINANQKKYKYKKSTVQLI